MIHSFSFKNFYSFADRVCVSFVVNEKAPKNDGYIKTKSGRRLSKAEVVVGPNASGKTNVLKVLPFLQWLIVDSFSFNPDASLPLKPFLFGAYKDEPSELSVVFEINGDIYSYEFVLDKTRILSEKLFVENVTVKRTTKKSLFSRSWNQEKKEYEMDDLGFNLLKEFTPSFRQNASVLSVASRFNHKLSVEIADYWKSVKTNVVEFGWIGDQLFAPTAQLQLVDAISFYAKDENVDFKKKAESFLSNFDLGLQSFEIKKEVHGNNVLPNVEFSHLFENNIEFLPLQYESSGTKQLFVLLRSILSVLEKGGIAVIDEFDVNLHPAMVSKLFELFIHKETNPKNAQLIFSTHSLSILNQLDKQQIILVEKQKNGMSDLWRLDDMDNVRPDDNYFAKYLAGSYGAVPNIF